MENITEDKIKNDSKNISIENILTNLKILSNIKPNDKLINDGDNLIIDQPEFTDL